MVSVPETVTEIKFLKQEVPCRPVMMLVNSTRVLKTVLDCVGVV